MDHELMRRAMPETVAFPKPVVDAAHLSIHAREKYLAGKIFEWAGDVGVITINPGWVADNYMAAPEPISQFGLMALPLGEGLNARPSNEDIARFIAGAFIDPAPCVGRHSGGRAPSSCRRT